MSDHAAALPNAGAPAPGRTRRRWWTRVGGGFLFGSVLVHLLFGVGATYLVVQTIAAKRKQEFTAQPARSNENMRAAEHKVQMAKKQQTMSAPAPTKRTTTASATQITLPSVPALPRVDSGLTPLSMSGMGGTGTGLSLGTGGTRPGSVGGGNSLPLFGFREKNSPGLEGTFYDLKQTSTRQPTNMTPDLYGKIALDFVNGGFNPGVLNRFFKSDQKVYAPQIWIPKINADLGPAAFQLQSVVQPRMWCVHYKGRVIAPASFTFHFVGAGDDLMFVRFNGRLVLDRCWYLHTNWHPQAEYAYDFSNIPHGFAKGDAIKVEAGQSYTMEVLIGEQPGGESFAILLQEIDGVKYDKDPKGNPILPVFRMFDSVPTASTTERPYPPHRDDGPVWRVDNRLTN